MMALTKFDNVVVNSTVFTPQQSSRIGFDKRRYESIRNETIQQTSSYADSNGNVLDRNHAFWGEDIEESYEEMRFVLHRKLLRRRHVRKEQKRLMRQKTNKVGRTSGRSQAINTSEYRTDIAAVKAGGNRSTDLKLGQICQQSSTSCYNGFHSVSEQKTGFNNLSPTPVSIGKGHHSDAKRCDDSLLDLTGTSTFPTIQSNKRRRFS
mmetsp:Transcript_18159/g.27472  ORF Transcript_18159/g.27472 Transcript_18159/m.27472 type:complete len:207 (-) Transcript_18159:265-885(-)